jgi:hypothetical protein
LSATASGDPFDHLIGEREQDMRQDFRSECLGGSEIERIVTLRWWHGVVNWILVGTADFS